MPLDYPLKTKGTTTIPANTARDSRGSLSNLFNEMLKKGFLRAKTAGNAGLEGCFILNVRKGISIISSPKQLVCTPPHFPQIPHHLFFNTTLQIHTL